MKSIDTLNSVIHFGSNAYDALNLYLNRNPTSKLFVLVDEHTKEFCLPVFLKNLEADLNIHPIEMRSGEIHKNIESYTEVLNCLTEQEGDRKSLLINLGGGVITDLGGFVASTFKRGIRFINIPTSLLAMVDASIGGKTGIDLGGLKNQVGVMSFPEMVLIDPSFLKTLADDHYRSGIAEMLKHGLIADERHWQDLRDCIAASYDNMEKLIYDSVLIKHQIVIQDPYEKGLRKTLNYGHTLGHAIESFYLNHSERPSLLHGEAIAIGVILESYISSELYGFPKEKLQEAKQVVQDLFGTIEIEKSDIDGIIDLLKYDKKNAFGRINFVLLEDIARPLIDKEASNQLINDAFTYYTT